jgi:hypothetical protein
MYDAEVAVPRLLCWYGGSHGRKTRQDTTVAIVSFGSPRVLALRPRVREGAEGAGRESLRFALGHGDLVVMGGSCRRRSSRTVIASAWPGRRSVQPNASRAGPGDVDGERGVRAEVGTGDGYPGISPAGRRPRHRGTARR